MSAWKKDALVSLKGDLKSHVLLDTGLADKLQIPAGGFMSAAEAQSVTALSNKHEQMGRLIDILQGKGNDEFHIFCELLRQTNNTIWADALERKAEEHLGRRSKGMHAYRRKEAVPYHIIPTANWLTLHVCTLVRDYMPANVGHAFGILN